MKVVKDRASTSTLELAGADGYLHLKKLIMLLKMGKPPVNIPPEKLFLAISGEFNSNYQYFFSVRTKIKLALFIFMIRQQFFF